MSTLNLWPTLAPLEVVEAIDDALLEHRLLWADTVSYAVCECGWMHETPEFERVRDNLHRRHLAEVIASVGGVA